MLYGCYAMFGLSFVAALIIITMIWSRLAHYGTSGTARVPTLWIVLGPLGQAITAVGLLGANAAHAVSPELASGMAVFGDPLRRAGVGLRGALDRVGHRTDGADPAARNAVRADVVEPDLSGRHLRHRHHPTGALHTGLPAFRVAAVVAYAGLLGDLGPGGGPDRARQPAGKPVPAAVHRPAPIKAKKDPPAADTELRCPVLPSGRGVRRQHGAIRSIDHPRDRRYNVRREFLLRPRGWP